MLNLGAAEFAAISTIVFLIIGISLLPLIFFCLTLQKCLKRCSPHNRMMSPGEVWLLLIPLFNLVWQFVVVLRISSTLSKEFHVRNMQREPEPGKSIGLAFCILYVCSLIPFLGIFTSLAGFICWIIYWVKIAGYSAEISVPVASSDEKIVI